MSGGRRRQRQGSHPPRRARPEVATAVVGWRARSATRTGHATLALGDTPVGFRCLDFTGTALVLSAPSTRARLAGRSTPSAWRRCSEAASCMTAWRGARRRARRSSESTESPKRPGLSRGRRREPAPRYRIRRDDGRERIDTPAAGALCKAGTRSTAEGSGRPGDGTARLLDGPKARRASACSTRDACAPPARTPTFSRMREQQQRRPVGLRRIGRRCVASTYARAGRRSGPAIGHSTAIRRTLIGMSRPPSRW
jgi:hypothetical protein